MKVIVKISGDPGAWFLVDLGGHSGVRTVRRHVERGRYAEAIVSALSSGAPASELPARAAAACRADLVLTDTSAHWDLTSGR